jgi:hypothetical protein
MSESQNHSLTSGAAAPVSVDFREKKNRHRLWTSCSSILLNWQIATAKTRPNGLLPQRVVSYLSNEFDDFWAVRRVIGAVLLEPANITPSASSAPEGSLNWQRGIRVPLSSR